MNGQEKMGIFHDGSTEYPVAFLEALWSHSQTKLTVKRESINKDFEFELKGDVDTCITVINTC